MSYLSKKDLEYLKNIDIQKVGVYYTTHISNIKAERRKDYKYYVIEDGIVPICETELLNDTIDLNYCDFNYNDEDEFYDFINNLLKKYNHYLIIAFNSKYNGSSGYKIVDNIVDVFYREYECSQYIKNISKGGKFLLLREYSHDVPMGHYTLVMGLTDIEYEKFNNMPIENIIEVGKNKVENMI